MNKNRNILSERSKFIKHKFNKQMDFAKSKKFIKEDAKNTIEVENLNSNIINYNYGNICLNNNFNINIDTSMYNSYRSVNSSERKNKKFTDEIVNYYLINRIEDNKDLIFYNGEDTNSFKYDDNYKCYYSLDNKSRIIYIKPSPKLLSSISSILNSKIISKRATKNISNEESGKFSQTPKGNDNNLDLHSMNVDHNSIVEKLKNLELMRNDKELDIIYNKSINSSSEDEGESDSDQFY
jgi:hypothetical protein